MKKFSWLIACFLTLSVSAQEKLVALGKAPNVYVNHKVAGGEVLSTIANQYGSTSAQLAKFNGIKVSALLKKGMLLKIPLTRNNLAQGQSATFNEPVYHLVAKGDNLYHISQSFHNVNIQSLRDWNGIKKDAIRNGQPLIVGYIKSSRRGDQSVKADPPKQTAITPPVSTLPVETAGTASVVMPMTKKNTPPVTQEPVHERKQEAVPVVKDEIKYVPKQGDEGYFAVPFAQRNEALAQQFRSGDAGIFKTISGWSDRKFYVLMNDVAPGTIVRITSPANKSICAKVLDGLVETKGAAGLLLRMSNAAAVALDIADVKSTVSVTFFE